MSQRIKIGTGILAVCLCMAGIAWGLLPVSAEPGKPEKVDKPALPRAATSRGSSSPSDGAPPRAPRGSGAAGPARSLALSGKSRGREPQVAAPRDMRQIGGSMRSKRSLAGAVGLLGALAAVAIAAGPALGRWLSCDVSVR